MTDSALDSAFKALLRRRLHAVQLDDLRTRFGCISLEMRLEKLPQELRDPLVAAHPRVPGLLAQLEALAEQARQQNQRNSARVQHIQGRLLELLQLELRRAG